MSEQANIFLRVPEDQYDRNWREWQRPYDLAASSLESGWGHAQRDKWLLGMAVICTEAEAKDREIESLKAKLAAALGPETDPRPASTGRPKAGEQARKPTPKKTTRGGTKR
jgi:hypothetical protein